MIKQTNKVAVVAGDRLGDGLILQLITYNLHLNGYDTTLFNTPLLTLKEWFPWAKIEPHFPQAETKERLKDFDTLIFQHPNRHAREAIEPSQERIVLYGGRYLQRRPLLDLYLEACHHEFQLPQVVRSNGIVIPKNLKFRTHTKRVVIHPTSLCPEKNWPRTKFVELAHKLKALGFDPKFTVSPAEEKDWLNLKEEGFDLVIFPKLTQLASYLHESAFMLGNDSGIAHLASNVNIPAIALFIRQGVAKRWQPSFSKSYPVVPWLPLPGPKLKERYWKQTLSVSKVLRSFKKATREFA